MKLLETSQRSSVDMPASQVDAKGLIVPSSTQSSTTKALTVTFGWQGSVGTWMSTVDINMILQRRALTNPNRKRENLIEILMNQPAGRKM